MRACDSSALEEQDGAIELVALLQLARQTRVRRGRVVLDIQAAARTNDHSCTATNQATVRQRDKQVIDQPQSEIVSVDGNNVAAIAVALLNVQRRGARRATRERCNCRWRVTQELNRSAAKEPSEVQSVERPRT